MNEIKHITISSFFTLFDKEEHATDDGAKIDTTAKEGDVGSKKAPNEDTSVIQNDNKSK